MLNVEVDRADIERRFWPKVDKNGPNRAGREESREGDGMKHISIEQAELFEEAPVKEEKDEDGETLSEIVKRAPEITGKQVYYLGVCEKHRLNESFVLKSYRSKMPKHWREQRTGCCHSNCYQDATDWLIVDLSEATFKK